MSSDVTEAVPFEGCSPATSTEHAAWVVDSLSGRDGVAFVVPATFERCVRVHHSLDEGQRWADTAPQYLQRGIEASEYPFPDSVEAVAGDMGDEVVDRLVELIEGWSGSTLTCHYALWCGWGDLNGSSTALYSEVDPRRRCFVYLGSPREGGWFKRASASLHDRFAGPKNQVRTEPEYVFLAKCSTIDWWGGRDRWLFDGPLSAVRPIGSTLPWDKSVRRRGPQWWWPSDRRWFVANEIDDPWSYVAGPHDLIEIVLADLVLETVEVDFTDQW